MSETAVSGRNLAKSFKGGRIHALCGVDITIRKSEIFGLLGPNGAGKTTLLSILATIIRPDKGSVEIFGCDLKKNTKDIRRIIGLVPQDIALYPNLTARENLRYFGRMHNFFGKELEDRIDESLDAVGLKKRGEDRVETYSGGMKRRANLAVGLLNRPKILMLDEPTVGIDVQSRNRILQWLEELKKYDITLIYSTNYMEEAQKICDRIAIIDEGKIISSGDLAELLCESDECQDLEELFLKLTGKQLRD